MSPHPLCVAPSGPRALGAPLSAPGPACALGLCAQTSGPYPCLRLDLQGLNALASRGALFPDPSSCSVAGPADLGCGADLGSVVSSLWLDHPPTYVLNVSLHSPGSSGLL